MLKRVFLSVLIAASSVYAGAQDLSGIWRGSFHSSGSKMMEIFRDDDRYKFEVQLDQKSKAFKGVTYSYKTTVFYGKASCSGTINPNTKKVLLEELRILEVRMASGDACIMTCFLTYSKSGDEEFLEGSYTSMNVRDSSNCGKGTIFLRKVPTSDFYLEDFLVKKEKEKELATKKPPVVKTPESSSPPATKITPKSQSTPPPVVKKATPSKPPVKREAPVVKTTPKENQSSAKDVTKTAPIDSIKKESKPPAIKVPVPKVISSRTNELVKTFTTDANEVVINIYDNGTIDNDTISVYLDNRMVVARQRLTEKAISFKFQLDENTDYHEVVMVAENLGEIPPNTSLMVVKAGDQTYEVRITSNEQKNAVVGFRYEKKP